MGVPINELWQADQDLSVEDKIKLRGILSTYNIKTIDDSDGHLQMFVDGELIAEWHKPQYKMKRDLSEIDPGKKLYVEMHADYWSIFDEEN